MPEPTPETVTHKLLHHVLNYRRKNRRGDDPGFLLCPSEHVEALEKEMKKVCTFGPKLELVEIPFRQAMDDGLVRIWNIPIFVGSAFGAGEFGPL